MPRGRGVATNIWLPNAESMEQTGIGGGAVAGSHCGTHKTANLVQTECQSMVRVELKSASDATDKGTEGGSEEDCDEEEVKPYYHEKQARVMEGGVVLGPW